MAYCLGIDGGGTKTRCALADETSVLATAMSGGSNVVRLGEKRATEALRAVIRHACAAAKIAPRQVGAVCIGAAGAAQPEIAARLRAILSELIPGIKRTKIEVVGDNVIALEAAFGEGPGVIVIAGTGSIVFGRDALGHTVRAGGWGFAISDEGSGQWIGRRAVAAVLNTRDQGAETLLTSMILETWRLKSIDDLVRHANATPPPDFQRLFPVVLRAADGADSISHNLLSEAGAELGRLASLVIRRLKPQGRPAKSGGAPAGTLGVAMTGSVFRQSQVVRQTFYNALEQNFPGISIRADLADPVAGALARARRL